jgi:membrane associated rhomboid family serine protease
MTLPTVSETPVSKPPLAQRVVRRFTPVLVLTAICWLVFVINNLLLGGSLTHHGIVPRHFAGLPGILWAPFLHTSFQHLAANTVPLLILGGILCARGKNEFVSVTASGIVLGGLLTWLAARTANHVGASGLIFCYFGYIASSAWFNRSVGTLLLSLVCIVGYGGMLRGILPTSAAVSWEGHLAGLISGVALAWLNSKARNDEPKPSEIRGNVDR